MKNKRFETTQKMIIKVFKKRQKKVFCEIIIDDINDYADLFNTLNSTARYVQLTPDIIIDKTEIDYMILEN